MQVLHVALFVDIATSVFRESFKASSSQGRVAYPGISQFPMILSTSTATASSSREFSLASLLEAVLIANLLAYLKCLACFLAVQILRLCGSCAVVSGGFVAFAIGQACLLNAERLGIMS